MAMVVPDAAGRLKPELIAAINKIYTQFCNLQPHTKVLIIGDSRAPDHVLRAFHGGALALGAEVVTVEATEPAGGATYQPSTTWPSMLAAAALEADLIVDMAVGYAPFVAAAVRKGARVISPGDGIGMSYLDDVLIRTVLHTDVDAIRRRADAIAERFSSARELVLATGEGDALTIDISDLDGVAGDGFLWDPDRSTWRSAWSILPPAQPGVLIPKGRGTGTVNVDGSVLWRHAYQETPTTPLRLTYANGRLVSVAGDRVLARRLEVWLADLDDGASCGPVHANIGINPAALLSQHPEWERVYGSVTCGMGDLSLLSQLTDTGGMELVESAVHWDWTVLQPTVLLDGNVIVDDGRIRDTDA